MKPWILVPLLAGVLSAHAASFDCAKAKTPREKAICASPALSTADDQMAAAYRAWLAVLPPGVVPEAREEQRGWLQQLAESCKADEANSLNALTLCMLNRYPARISELRAKVLNLGEATFYLRSIELTYPDAPGESSELEETRGFGTFRATWPQSTSKTAEWQAWNKAIEAAAQGLVASNGKKSPSGKWLPEWAAGGDFELTASVDLVSQELVTASIGLEGMGHGAAHPSEEGLEFNWLLKQGRELRSEDVFRKDSDWEKSVEAVCSEELQRDDSEGLYDNWESALKKVVLNSQNWELDAKGLTIDFPEYSVSPRAFPVSPVTIPWATLRPFLQPGFAIPK